MIHSLLRSIKQWLRKPFLLLFPELSYLSEGADYLLKNSIGTSEISNKARLYLPYHISKSKVGDYSYIAENSHIQFTEIGKFCSIGPNFFCGRGIHPTNGISTNPMFYSTLKQNGTTLSNDDKITENKKITIGNDVFIGANVIILDGVTIGDGAVIGAGAVVSKDIPPYAIAVGSPIHIIRYRFNEETIQQLLKLRWWDFKDEELQDVEQSFFKIDSFLQKHYAK